MTVSIGKREGRKGCVELNAVARYEIQRTPKIIIKYEYENVETHAHFTLFHSRIADEGIHERVLELIDYILIDRNEIENKCA